MIRQQQNKSNLQLSILCSIMKWGPSPVILDDLWTHLKQLLQDAIMPSAGSKVQSSGSISVLAGQADVSVCHLFRVHKNRTQVVTETQMFLVHTSDVSQLTSHTTTAWWPMWAAACRQVMPSWALRWTPASHSVTRYSTTCRCPSWQAR